jgi:hypothetical protein
MAHYLPDYRQISTELDLAEDATLGRRGKVSPTARERLVGAMRMDSLLVGSVCIADTAAFTGVQFVTLWTDEQSCFDSMPDFFDSPVALPTGRLTLLGRAPTLRESLLRFVFRSPDEVAPILLHLAPRGTETIQTTRARAAELQDGLGQLNAAGGVKNLHDAAQSLVEARSERDEFVRRLVEPYRRVLGTTWTDPEIAGFVAGWTALLVAEERGVLEHSTPDTSIPNRTAAEFRRLAAELRTALESEDELRDGELSHHLRTGLGSLDRADVRESDLQRVVRLAIREADMVEELEGIDRDAAATVRTSLPLLNKELRERNGLVAPIARRLDQLFKDCEDVRARHFCAQHRIPHIQEAVLSLGKATRIESLVPDVDPLVLMGRANLRQVRSIVGSFEEQLRTQHHRLAPPRSKVLEWSALRASTDDEYAVALARWFEECVVSEMDPPSGRVRRAVVSATGAAAVTAAAGQINAGLGLAGGAAALAGQWLHDLVGDLLSQEATGSVSPMGESGERLAVVRGRVKHALATRPTVVTVARRVTRRSREGRLADHIQRLSQPPPPSQP